MLINENDLLSVTALYMSFELPFVIRFSFPVNESSLICWILENGQSPEIN